MANVTYLTDCANRLVAMEKDMLNEVYSTVDAVPYTFFTSPNFPFWTNTLSGYAPNYSSEVLSVRPYLWIARYHMGFRTQGNSGDLEKQLYADLPYIENFFMEHQLLTSSEYTSPADHLDPISINVNLSRGLVEFPAPEDGGTPTLGTVIEIITPYNITIAQQD